MTTQADLLRKRDEYRARIARLNDDLRAPLNADSQEQATELENRDEYNPDMLHDNLMFGTPDEVIEKLRLYEALGVDHFTYSASLGLGFKEQKRSLELFIEEVMPAFA